MDMDLDARGAKWKREEQRRREQAKRKLQSEQLRRAAADRARLEIEAAQARRRQEQLLEAARAEERALEEQRVTGGIKYLEHLRPVPTTRDGDKITLPVSALEQLNPQNAHELGVFTFELSYAPTAEGTVGLPPKVAASLFQQCSNGDSSHLLPESIQVKFVRLEKGKFASLQPRGDGFGEREIDLKKILERSLKAHTTLTVGDVLFVRHGKETFEVAVAELQPERAVNILNTDLEVALQPSEAIANAKEIERQREAAAAAAAARAQAEAAEKARWKAEKTAQLAPEPPCGERMQAKVVLRMPGGEQQTRQFLHEHTLGHIFAFVEALTGDDADSFRLVATFPRRVFGVDSREKTLKELGLNGRQESLFVESVAVASPAAQDPEAALGPESAQRSVRTVLPDEWERARQALETSLDESANQETKWEAQLLELEAMGFLNRALNIDVLERYQGRLLRVVNYLSEVNTDAALEGGVAAMEE
ncbi:hypothetical protein PybrP1_006313 [[Pythium] brassicae (nom. inval.)]|nr:hypothetical protein PybrP1_006313 [[Pythium] brassicae (nom. inval.)]